MEFSWTSLIKKTLRTIKTILSWYISSKIFITGATKHSWGVKKGVKLGKIANFRQFLHGNSADLKKTLQRLTTDISGLFTLNNSHYPANDTLLGAQKGGQIGIKNANYRLFLHGNSTYSLQMERKHYRGS